MRWAHPGAPSIHRAPRRRRNGVVVSRHENRGHSCGDSFRSRGTGSGGRLFTGQPSAGGIPEQEHPRQPLSDVQARRFGLGIRFLLARLHRAKRLALRDMRRRARPGVLPRRAQCRRSRVPASVPHPWRAAPECYRLVRARPTFDRHPRVSAMRLTACRCMMALASVNLRCFKSSSSARATPIQIFSC